MPHHHPHPLKSDPQRGTARSHPMFRKHTSETLDVEFEALRTLPIKDLRERWEDLSGNPCPRRISRRLLAYAIAYRIQENMLGGLDRPTRRRLDRAAKNLAAGRPPAPPKPSIKPGTKLLREWQGTVHEVIVLERGVEYCGKTWTSLSAVAREITGARWSGPRFFGLKGSAGGQG